MMPRIAPVSTARRVNSGSLVSARMNGSNLGAGGMAMTEQPEVTVGHHAGAIPENTDRPSAETCPEACGRQSAA